MYVICAVRRKKKGEILMTFGEKGIVFWIGSGVVHFEFELLRKNRIFLL